MNLLDVARLALAEAKPHKPAAGGDGGRHFRWRVAIPGRVFEVRTSPEMTAAEVCELYRGADVEPILDAPQRPVTEAERAELRALVQRILPDKPGEWDEALHIAAADPEAALLSFRALANDC